MTLNIKSINQSINQSINGDSKCIGYLLGLNLIPLQTPFPYSTPAAYNNYPPANSAQQSYPPSATLSGTSDISIACNNLAQKYLFAGSAGSIPSGGEQTPLPRQKILPAKESLYGGGQDSGGFSIATQNYLERHRLTDHHIPRKPGRLYTESIIEACNEDDSGSFVHPNGGGRNDEQARRNSQTPQQRRPQEMNRPKLVDLDLEQLRNLPKLPPKKAAIPFWFF